MTPCVLVASSRVSTAGQRARWRSRRRRRSRCRSTGAADRCRRVGRAAAQRPALLHPPQRPPGQPRVAASGGQRRLDPRGQRSARAGAFPRAHGVQRHRELQAGRAGRVPRVDRRAVRSARQRLHVVRRDRLHARRAHRPRRYVDRGLLGAARLRRRHAARCPRRSRRSAASSSKSGAAGSARGRGCTDKQLPVLLRESRYAERLPIGTPEISRRFRASGCSTSIADVVSPRSDGRGRRRRHRAAEASGCRAAVRRHPAAEPAPRAVDRGAAAQGDARSASRPIPKRRAGRCRSRTSGRSRSSDTVGDYRRSLIQQLGAQMLNCGCARSRARPNAPFLGAEAGGCGLGARRSSCTARRHGAGRRHRPGLEALVSRRARMQQFGFTARGARSRRAALLAFFERAYKERDTARARATPTSTSVRSSSSEPIPGHRVRVRRWRNVPADRHARRSHERRRAS